MPQHVELALTETTGRLRADRSPPVEGDKNGSPPAAGYGLSQWSVTVVAAAEPCLIINIEYVIVAASRAGCALLGLAEPATTHGQHLLSAVRLLDFADGEQLDDSEAKKIAPILAITSKRLARGLIRVVGAPPKEQLTLDTIATPLWEGSTVAGSLTFFGDVNG